jgi:AcrR family transcriptional regulator
MRQAAMQKVAASASLRNRAGTKPHGRVVKHAEVRKGELVDCAEALFFSKGYEATTVADIIARAGVSKGGFYHHFLSKEDLLEAVVARLTRTIIAGARDILDDDKLDALTKLNRFFARNVAWKAETASAMKRLYTVFADPANAVLYQRIVRAGVEALAPVLAKLVEQGNREGTFDAPDPGIVAEMLLHITNARQALTIRALAAATHGETDKATAMFIARIRKEEALVNRILGLPKGSVRFIDRANFRKVLAALAQ